MIRTFEQALCLKKLCGNKWTFRGRKHREVNNNFMYWARLCLELLPHHPGVVTLVNLSPYVCNSYRSFILLNPLHFTLHKYLPKSMIALPYNLIFYCKQSPHWYSTIFLLKILYTLFNFWTTQKFFLDIFFIETHLAPSCIYFVFPLNFHTPANNHIFPISFFSSTAFDIQPLA
jgi:hypothetical protein